MSKKSFFDEGGNGNEGNYYLLVGWIGSERATTSLRRRSVVSRKAVSGFVGSSKIFIKVRSVDTALTA